MMTGLLAARNIDGASHDVWGVNVDAAYHEQGDASDTTGATGATGTATAEPVAGRQARGGDPLVPAGAGAFDMAAQVRQAFAVYDPLALATAVGTIAGLGLFLATATALLRRGDVAAPNLSLLGQYLLGYSVSWGGALLGLLEGAVGGFLFGGLLARAINRLIEREKRILLHRLAANSALGLIEGERA